jgi:hypothetical protein
MSQQRREGMDRAQLASIEAPGPLVEGGDRTRDLSGIANQGAYNATSDAVGDTQHVEQHSVATL